MFKKIICLVLVLNMMTIMCFTSFGRTYNKTEKFLALLEEQTQENILIVQTDEKKSNLYVKLKSSNSKSVINGWWNLVIVLDRYQLNHISKNSFWFSCYDEEFKKLTYVIATKVDSPYLNQQSMYGDYHNYN